MSQHSLNIDNQAFPSFRADLNSALAALKSLNSGTVAPASPVAGMLWYDTTNTALKMYDGTAWQVVRPNGGLTFAELNTSAIASTGEAEAGTAANKLMTPERVSEAIAALGGGAGLKFCFVARSSSQSVSTSTLTKVLFNSDTGNFSDSENWFDTTTNHRFQPTEVGFYLVRMDWKFSSASDGAYTYASLYKNGSAHTPSLWGISQYAGGIKAAFSAEYIVEMNGTTDYLEGYVWQNIASTVNLRQNTGDTTFTALKIS
ncbi:MAG: hypothetical protein OSB62_07740 [Alphaproteobacteria bacterium]|nr:hypothetical protein [Alphaproteobacteria bacterium]